jgi:hypothetical protein
MMTAMIWILAPVILALGGYVAILLWPKERLAMTKTPVLLMTSAVALVHLFALVLRLVVQHSINVILQVCAIPWQDFVVIPIKWMAHHVTIVLAAQVVIYALVAFALVWIIVLQGKCVTALIALKALTAALMVIVMTQINVPVTYAITDFVKIQRLLLGQHVLTAFCVQPMMSVAVQAIQYAWERR